MSQKQRLLDLLAQLKDWHESNGDTALQKILDELEAEITAMDDTSGDPGGNNPGRGPKVP
jgi:hypothetical protein